MSAKYLVIEFIGEMAVVYDYFASHDAAEHYENDAATAAKRRVICVVVRDSDTKVNAVDKLAKELERYD